MKKAGIRICVLMIALVLTLSACGSSSDSTPSATNSPTAQPSATVSPSPIKAAMKWDKPPAMAIDQNKQYTATMKTNYGDIVIQLFPKDAPLAVNNFVFLARQGYYDGVKFHRVVKGFVIQGGDPTGTGGGDPGYSFADELVTRNYVMGTLAMANSGPDTNGSQFFICLEDLTNNLAKNYTIFGIVTVGMNVAQKIANVPTILGSDGAMSKPTVDVHIDTVLIEEK